MQRMLFTAGVILLVLGLLWPWLTRLGLGGLPGDISVQRPGFRFYAPLGTSLLISVVLTLIVWLMRR
jgi:membrane protein implicated in regulation of membrane protease activity